MNNIDILEEGIQKMIQDERIHDDYRNMITAISTLIAENKELKEREEAFETECRHWLGFCRRIRRDKKHNVDEFNQGREYSYIQFLNLLEGEENWTNSGKYFDVVDKQIEDMKQSRYEED